MFNLGKKKAPEGFIEIDTAESLLNTNHRKNLIRQIRDMVGTTDAVWKDFYLAQIKSTVL